MPEGHDIQTASGTSWEEKQEDILQYYRRIWNTMHVSVHFEDKKDTLLEKTAVFLKDIESHHVCNEHARYEFTRLTPNYGASSDILRYSILYEYGGAYFDTDIRPGRNGLDDAKIFREYENHVVYVDHLSQRLNPTREQLSNFTVYDEQAKTGVGNDAFICTKNNPCVRILCELVHRNYTELTWNEKLHRAYGANTIYSTTIEQTGPGVVRKALSGMFTVTPAASPLHTLIIEGEEVELKAMRTVDQQLSMPIPNQRSWLSVPLARCGSLEEAIQRAWNTLEYELKNFKILRLDDHLNHILRAMENSVEESVVIAALCEKMRTLPLQEVEVAQLVSNRASVQSFYAEYGLEPKTFWSEEKYFSLIFGLASNTDLLIYYDVSGFIGGSVILSSDKLEELLYCVEDGLLFVKNHRLLGEDHQEQYAQTLSVYEDFLIKIFDQVDASDDVLVKKGRFLYTEVTRLLQEADAEEEMEFPFQLQG